MLEIEAHLREVVALCLDLLLKVRDILGDPVELILVCLGILWNLFAWERRWVVLFYFEMNTDMFANDDKRHNYH